MELDLELAKKGAQEFHSKTFQGAFKHITYSEKIDKTLVELFNTNPKEVIKWGWGLWDNILGGIYGGKVYVIGGDTGAGKSTFINQLSMSLARQGINVTKYSLEDRMEDIGKEDLFTYINKIRYNRGEKLWSFPDFVNNEYFHTNGKYYNPLNKDYISSARDLIIQHNKSITELDKNKMVTIDDLIKLMEDEVSKGVKVFMIDHLHYFQKINKERTDIEIENTMHAINEIARKYNVAIFLVAHYRKLNNSQPNNDSFKDASAIKQVANIIIHITRDGGLTQFVFGKIRGKIWCNGFNCNYSKELDSYIGFSLIEN